MSLVLTSFLATLTALVKIALIIVVSAWLVRRKVFDEKHIRALTAMVVNLALPCLIFSSFVRHFDVSEFPHWWKFPLIGAVMVFCALILSRLVLLGTGPTRNTLTALASLQNAGYLILPIGEVLFPTQFERFSIYIFLMLFSYIPILWGLGVYLISHRQGMKLKPGHVLNPPFCTMVLAMVLVFTGLAPFIPELILEPVELVGASCVPLATVVLGLTMGLLHVGRLPSFFNVLRVIGVKLVAVPLIMFWVLKYTSFSSGSLEDAFWILQASSPPATALALQVIHYGGDENLVCGILVACYLAALFTIPLFFSLVQVFI
ncbi:AEC family transporter [Gemmatimonadota bacterium]